MSLTLATRPALRVGLIALAALVAIAAAFICAAIFDVSSALPLLPAFGSVTLAQSALLSQNELQKGVLETFVIESPLLDRIPMMEIEGNAFAYDEEGTLPGVEFRAVNAAYSESTGTVNQKTESLVILGGDADVDTFIQKTRSNVNDQRALQDQLKVKAAAYKYQDAFINGDTAVDANSFDGLKKRLTGAQVIPLATNGAGVNVDSATRQNFLDFLDALIAAVPGLSAGNGALFMNTVIRAKILSALRRENLSVEAVGRLPEPIRQSVGPGQPIAEAQLPTYNGIPMIDIGSKADGSLIIPQTETQGTAVDASSIYAVRFGSSEADQGVTGLTNGGVDVRDLGELQAKPALRTRIEFFTGLGVFGGKAAARGTGVRNL